MTRRRPPNRPISPPSTPPQLPTREQCLERFWDILAPALLEHYAAEQAQHEARP